MYTDQFRQYPQEYETNYGQENGGNSQFYYDYNEPNIMVNQPRMESNMPQYRNQKYMSYHINPQVKRSPHNSFNHGTSIYDPNRNTQHNVNFYGQSQPQPQYNIPNPNNVYTQRHLSNSPPQFVSIQTHQLMIKQYRLTLNMIKTQNNALIEKLKTQIKKMIQQYKLVKDLILSGQLSTNTNSFLENIKQNQIITENQQNPTGSFESNSQTFQIQTGCLQRSQATQIDSNYQSKLIKDKLIKEKLISPTLILENKIKSLNQKRANQQKVKIESSEKPQQNSSQADQSSPSKSSNLPLQTKLKTSFAGPQINQNVANLPETNDDLFELQPIYPDDFSGEESFLVDETVLEKQNKKKMNCNDSKANTFGIIDPTNKQLEFKPHEDKEDKELKNEVLLIYEFLDHYLCQKLTYAPKKQFMNFKILKNQLLKIFINWRSENKGLINLVIDRRIIQTKLTQQFRRRFASCKDDRTSFIGLKFKDPNFLRNLYKRK